jgi:hypothetical protein
MNYSNSNKRSDTIIVVKPTTYYSNFRNTENLPITPIINTIEDEYTDYLYLSNQENKSISLLDLFDVNFEKFLQPAIGNFKGTNIKNKKSFPLDKLISYLIYTKSSFLLEEKNNSFELNISGIKSQIGKDIIRIDLYVNDQKQNFKLLTGGDPDTPEKNTSYLTKIPMMTNQNPIDEDKDKENINMQSEMDYGNFTDKYYETLMQNDPGKIIDNIKFINYNFINEIGILSCQNIFNFISELIQSEMTIITKSILTDSYLLISPSSKQDSNGKSTISDNKELLITVKEKEKKVNIYFDTYLFTSSDFTAVGRMTFILTADLMLNSFQFDMLDIEYNLESMIMIPVKPKYTTAQTAKYYGITNPSRFLKRKLFSPKGGKTRKQKTKEHKRRQKQKKTRKQKNTRKQKKTTTQ